MDPISNPTPMQSSGLDAQATGSINPVVTPAVPPAPVASSAPVTAPAPAVSATPTTTPAPAVSTAPLVAPAPVVPVMPVPPASPATITSQNVSSVAPATPAMAVPPVSPVVNPATLATPSVTEANVQAFGIPVAPTAPVFNPGENSLVGATDPITLPTSSQSTDLVEDELNTPLKAADPVPGSIGSAISVPAIENDAQNNANPVPSVAFNDPATEENPMINTSAPVKTKKKSNKTTLIALSVIALMVAIALATVLVMQLM